MPKTLVYFDILTYQPRCLTFHVKKNVSNCSPTQVFSNLPNNICILTFLAKDHINIVT